MEEKTPVNSLQSPPIDKPLPPTVPPGAVFPPIVQPNNNIPIQPPINPPLQSISTVAEDGTPSGSNNSKKWIWIAIGGAGLVVLAAVAFFAVKFLAPKNTSQDLTGSSNYSNQSYEEIAIPTATPLPVTIAPPGTPDWRLDQFRTKRATVAEAQEMNKTVGPTIGEIQFPSSLTFTHEEVYKGIPIRWTDAQPISPQRLEWIKAAIDKLPPLFVNDHPITGIYSATPEELGVTDALNKSSYTTGSAFASGIKIFLTNNILVDKPGYEPLPQIQFESTIYHEWMHIVQYYEALQTFSDSYLKIPGNSKIAISLSPFTKDFAKLVGWEFLYDEAGNNWSGTLKTDSESQKTSDYGKSEYYEDQADTAAAFFICQTSKYSQIRIQWMEKISNTTADSYCH